MVSDTGSRRGRSAGRRHESPPAPVVAVAARTPALAQAIALALRARNVGATAAAAEPDAVVAAVRDGAGVLLLDGRIGRQLDACAAAASAARPGLRILVLAAGPPPAPGGGAVDGAETVPVDLRVGDLARIVTGDARSDSVAVPRPPASAPRCHEAELLHQLTRRERQVLRLLMAGCTGEDIAETLEISPNTVRTHCQNIFAKLDARDRVEAAIVGFRGGFEPESAPDAVGDVA